MISPLHAKLFARLVNSCRNIDTRQTMIQSPFVIEELAPYPPALALHPCSTGHCGGTQLGNSLDANECARLCRRLESAMQTLQYDLKFRILRERGRTMQRSAKYLFCFEINTTYLGICVVRTGTALGQWHDPAQVRLSQHRSECPRLVGRNVSMYTGRERKSG